MYVIIFIEFSHDLESSYSFLTGKEEVTAFTTPRTVYSACDIYVHVHVYSADDINGNASTCT